MGCINVRTLDSRVKKHVVVVPDFHINEPESFKILDYKLISHSYTITPSVLGKGHYGKVLLGHNTSKPELKVAIKTL